MAEDSRQTSPETSLPINHQGSTSFILFTEEMEGQDVSESEKLHATSNNDEDEKNEVISGESIKSAKRSCTSSDEENIPASVRELLTLLVNRAAQIQSEELLPIEGYNSAGGSSKVNLLDESWKSSMATPPKFNSTLIEANDSTLVNFKFETSDLDVPEEKYKVIITNSSSLDQRTEETLGLQCNRIFSKVDYTHYNSASVANNSFLEHELMSNSKSKPLDDSSTVIAGKEKQNLNCPNVNDCPDNSFLEDVINVSVADEHADIGTSFLMSTPIKERSNLKINFNLRKYSFASVSLPLENNIDDKSALEESVDCNLSLNVNKCMSSLPENNTSEGNLDISDGNSQSLLKNITPVVNSNPATEEISHKINDGDFLSTSDELETVVTDEVVLSNAACDETYCNLLNSPISCKKIDRKAYSPKSDDMMVRTESLSKSVTCVTVFCDKDTSPNDLTGERATVIISGSKGDVQMDLFESLRSSSMESETKMAQDGGRSTFDDISHGVPFCYREEILAPATGNLNDQDICCDKNEMCSSESKEMVLIDNGRSVSIGACARDTLATHNGQENGAQVIDKDLVSGYKHCSGESVTCSAESVITCCNRSTDNLHCESPISGEVRVISEGNTNANQLRSNCEPFLYCTDLMQTVPVNDNNIISTDTQDNDNVIKSMVFSEIKINSLEQMEAVILNGGCSSAKDIECNYRKLPSDTQKTEIRVRNASTVTMTPMESSKSEEDGTLCVVSGESSKKAKCKSGIVNSYDGQVNVMTKDVNEVGFLSPTLQKVSNSDDQIIKPQAVNDVEREEHAYGNKTSPLDTSGSQNVKLENNSKNVESSESYISTKLGKPEFDAVFQKVEVIDTSIDEGEIFSCMHKSGVSKVDDLLRKTAETESGKSPELDRRRQRRGTSHGSNFSEKLCSDEELKVGNESQPCSQSEKMEFNHKLHRSLEPNLKSSKEEVMAYELNCLNSMENFFSETMDFECDKISVQTQDSVIQNPLRNSRDIFCEPKGQREAVINVNEMKIETQDACTSPSQDFLPSSVLEEVCQATEALVYHAKDKNECQLDYGMENEFLSSNFEADERKGTKKKVENDENMKNTDICVQKCSANQIHASERQGSGIETVFDEECFTKEEFKENHKKKIFFTALECMTSDEDIEVEIGAGNEIIKQKNKFTEAPNGHFPAKLKQILEYTIEDDSTVSTKQKETSDDRPSSAKAFIYPKRDKRISSVIQERVRVEDLMVSAVALEKCSTFFPKAKSFEIQLLKNESLVSFNHLEASLNKITNKNADDYFLSHKMVDTGDQVESFEKEISSAEELNDENGDVSCLLADIRKEEMLLKPEVSVPSFFNNELLKSGTKETESKSVRRKLVQGFASDISKNETMESFAEKTFSNTTHYNSGQDIGISMHEGKEADQSNVETGGKDEQCTSPILKVSSRRKFRRGGKVHHTTVETSNVSVVIPKSSERKSINSPENNVSLSLRETNNEEFCTKDSICKDLKAALTPERNSSTLAQNCEEANEHRALTTEEDDLFYEGDSLFMSSNLEMAIANEEKISVSKHDWVQSNNLYTKEITNSEKIIQCRDQVEKKPLEEKSELIQGNILEDNSVISAPFCDTGSGKISSKAQKLIFVENSFDYPDSQMTNGSKSKEVVLENVSEQAKQRKSVQRGKFSFDERYSDGGFLTASGKKLSVSEESIRKAEKLLSEEATAEAAGMSADIGNKMSNLTENYYKDFKISAEDLSEQRKVWANSLSISDCKKTSFSGKSRFATNRNIIESDTLSRNESVSFATASGKKVSVSEKALMNAKKLFTDEHLDAFEEQPTSIDNAKKSSLRKGQTNEHSSRCTSVGISKDELMQARELFCKEMTSAIKDFDRDRTRYENFTTSGETERPGFSTASGKKVSLSKKALMQAQKLFSEETNCPIQDFQNNHVTNENLTPFRNTVEFGFSTGSGKRVTVSNKALMKAQKLFSEASHSDIQTNRVLNENITPARSTDGVEFAIASGVSRKALLQVQNLSSEETKCSNQNLPKSDINNEDVMTSGGTLGVGFSSGSGKKITVSKKAMILAQKLYSEVSDCPTEDIRKDQVIDEAFTPLRSADRFSTASGKRVSDKSFAQVCSLFSSATDIQDFSLDQASNDDVNPARRINEVGGTSDGKDPRKTQAHEHLSKETKSAIQDFQISEVTNENGTSSRSMDNIGFSTGSGKKIAVSKKAMMQARKHYTDISDSYAKDFQRNEEIAKNKTPGSYGSTGNRITVSKRALTQAQKLSQKISDSEVKYFPNDQSINPDKSVVIRELSSGITDSKEALEQKKLFSETKNSSMEDYHKVTSESKIQCGSELGFSSANGKKVTVSTKALLRAHKLFSEVSNVVEQDSPKSTFNDEATAREATGFGFTTGSGKRVTLSEKSLLQAKKNFLENCSSRVDILEYSDALITSGAEKGSMQSELQCLEDYVTQGPIISNTKDRSAIDISSGGMKRFVSPAKSLSLAKKACLEGHTTSISCAFSTASGREVNVTEKALAHSKEQLDRESDSTSGNLSLKYRLETDKDIVSGETHIDTEHVFLEGCLNKKCEKHSPSFSKTSTRRSLSMARKLFTEDSLSVNSSDSLAQRFADSPDGMRNPVNIQGGRETPLSVKPVIRSKLNINKNLINVEKENLILNSESRQQASLLGIAKLKADDDSIFTSKSEEKFAGNESSLFVESQGDNYIKAVDLALIDSPAANIFTEHPPSPILKRTDRRRQRFKNVLSSRIKDKESSVSNLSLPDTSGPSAKIILSDSEKTVECLVSNKDERNLQLDLWGPDFMEESLLGRQLDLAEASNQLDATSHKSDIWKAARKRQEDHISSKKNVCPIVGIHLQKRVRKGSSIRSNLRDSLIGKRPQRYSKGHLRKFNVRESTLKVTATNAAEFQFLLKDHYVEGIKPSGVAVEDGMMLVPNPDGKFGAEEAEAALLAAPGVDPSLLPPGGWCKNHFRWIVWKLACSERSFPEELGGRYLTPENVMGQLKYRWDREIDRGERPALRKILEMDDTISKRIVLCISSIEKPENIQSSKKLELDLLSSCAKVELTDGWYAIRGMIDTEMAALIQKGKLSVGTKIVTSGAELVNGPPNGCHPLEPAATKAAIRLSSNSTRRARWDVKLGYVCNNPGPLPVSLGSLLPGGGAVSALRNVMLARVYPLLNVEKTHSGRKVIRNQRAEARVAAKFERQRQMWLENIYSQVSAEIQEEEEEEARMARKGKRGRSEQEVSNNSSKRIKRNIALDTKGCDFVPSPEDLLKLIEESEDSLQSLLTSSQLKMVLDYKQEERERRQRELEERVRQRIKEEEDKAPEKSSVASCGLSGGNVKRDVVSVLKARLVNADQPDLSKSAVLTVWRPSEEVISLLAKEGVTLNLYNLLSNGMRSSFLQLSSTRQTRYKVNTHLAHRMDRSLQRVILSQAFDDYISAKVLKLESISECMPPFGEVDLVAMVIKIGDAPEKEKHVGYQNVFVAGSDASLLSLAFWGGIEVFALEDVLVPGVTIAATNLQWRRHHGLTRLPTVHAVETSTFSQQPGEERLKKALKIFEDELKDEMQLGANKNTCKSDFLSYCEEKLAAVTSVGSKVAVSPKALAMSNICTKSELLVNSPSERIVLMKPSVAARMKKLQMYEGAAETALPMCHIKASPLAMKTFQPPARCPLPESSNNDRQACGALTSDSNSSPMSLDSEL